MATLADHIAARNDSDLMQRIVAAAEAQGISNPQMWAEANRGAIVSKTIGDTTLADVFAYAKATKGLPAGADPAIVTDEQIIAAVAAASAPA